MPSVLQAWVQKLTFMQQAVLMTAVRGPDGIPKNHKAKLLLRYFRRSFLIVCFTGEPILDPTDQGGGSFTGPSLPPIDPNSEHTAEEDELLMWEQMRELGREYLSCVDEIPHHFHLHLTHAAEILGYKHPYANVRAFWNWFYLAAVNDMHFFPESEALMDTRLGDNEANWRAREEVVAAAP